MNNNLISCYISGYEFINLKAKRIKLNTLIRIHHMLKTPYAEINLVKNLNKDQYLQFMLDIFYRNYKDKNMLITIYDSHKKLRFCTDLGSKILGVNLAKTIGESIFKSPVFKKNPTALRKYDALQSHVLSTGNSASIIIFDKYNKLIGATHGQITPIISPKNEICGLEVKTYDFTKLFWGAHHLKEAKETSEPEYDFSRLSPRQRQILLLLAFNFTQEQIAECFEITRGGVAQAISRICKFFKFNFSSSVYLLETLGRAKIIAQLNLPFVKINPCVIVLKHDFSHII